MNRSIAATAILLAGLMLGLAGNRVALAQVTSVWGGTTAYYGGTAPIGTANPTARYGAGYVSPNAAYTPLSSYRAPLGSAYNQHWDRGRWETLQPTYYQPSGVVSTTTPETTAGYTPSTVFPSAYSGVTAYRPVMPAVQTPNTVYSPVAAPIATPSMYVGRAVTTPPVIDTFAPRNFYRTAYYPTPVTYYRPVVAQDPVTGQAVTVLQPCTGQEYQARRQFSLFQSAANPTCTNCPSGYYGNGAVVPGPAVPSNVAPPVISAPPYGAPVGGSPYIPAPGTRSSVPADRIPTLNPDAIQVEPPTQYRERSRVEYRGTSGQYDSEYGEPDRDGWRNANPRRNAPIQSAPAQTAPRQTVREPAEVQGQSEGWRNADEPREYRARPTTPDSGYRDDEDQFESEPAPQRRQRVAPSSEPDADGWRNVEPGQTSKSLPRKKFDQPAREENARSDVRRPVTQPTKPLSQPSKRELVKDESPAMRGPRAQVRRETAAAPNEESASFAAQESMADSSSSRELPSKWEPRVNRPRVQPLRDENIEKPRLPRISTPPLLDREDRSAARPKESATASQNVPSSPVWAFVKVDWNRSKVRRDKATDRNEIDGNEGDRNEFERNEIERSEFEALPATQPSEDKDALEPIGQVDREELAPVKTNRVKTRGSDQQWQSMRGR